MAEHPSRLILVDLRATLAAINTANGFKTDVGDVTRTPEVRTKVPANSNFPWVGVTELKRDSQYYSSYSMRTTMQVVLTVHYVGTDRDDVELKMTRFYDDVKLAIGQDITLGGNATWCKLKEVRQGITSDAKAGFHHFELEIRYHERMNVAS